MRSSGSACCDGCAASAHCLHDAGNPECSCGIRAAAGRQPLLSPGHTYSEWSAEWWKWVLEANDAPYTTRWPLLWAEGQPEQVWFLPQERTQSRGQGVHFR